MLLVMLCLDGCRMFMVILLVVMFCVVEKSMKVVLVMNSYGMLLLRLMKVIVRIDMM